MGQTQKQNILLSLPFWWIALTVIYIPLDLFSSIFPSLMMPLSGFLGLFVPIGIWNFYLSSRRSVGFIVFPLVILIVFGGEYFLEKMNLSSLKKVLFVILTLFFLTIAVDFMIWGEWKSLEFFKSGGTTNISD